MVLFITDGQIGNWDDVKSVIQEGVQRNYCIWMQIGELTDQAKDVKKAGALVVPIKKYSDLPSTVLDLTKQIRFRK